TLYVLLFACVGVAPVLGDVRRRGIGRTRWLSPTLALSRGALLALPPLVVFGGLFAAADAQFDHLVSNLFELDAGDFLLHVVLIAMYAWLAGGVLREMLVAPARPRVLRDPPA